MKTAEKLLEIARGELGYHEKNSPENLEEKTAPNDGNGNFTKYARDLHDAGYYQAGKQGYEWCDVFADWCFWMLCGRDRAAAETMTCQTGVYGAGCEWSARYYAGKGRLDGTPRVGDQAFFGNRDHTGIVSAVQGTAVTVIEGNKNHQVEENTYHLGDGWLSGEFGHPFYEEEGEPQPESHPEPQPERVYTVQRGDTLWDIAVSHNTTADTLAALNGIRNPSLIFAGQELKLPGASVPDDAAPDDAAAEEKLHIGDRVRLHPDATVYGSRNRYSDWVYNTDLYIRELSGDRAVVSIRREGPITGPVDKKYLKKA